MDRRRADLFRLSEQRHNAEIASFRETVREVLEILKQNPVPDTFLGRKTHEPFPKEGPKEERGTE